MVLILDTSSDHLLYLYQVFKWTQKCTKGNNSITKGRVMVLLSAHPPTILYTLKRNRNATLSQWKIHGIWCKVLDSDNEPPSFQERLMNSTKYCFR